MGRGGSPMQEVATVRRGYEASLRRVAHAQHIYDRAHQSYVDGLPRTAEQAAALTELSNATVEYVHAAEAYRDVQRRTTAR
jgi:hypothetical protein